MEVTANSVHPGLIATNLFRHYSFVTGNLLNFCSRLAFDFEYENNFFCFGLAKKTVLANDIIYFVFKPYSMDNKYISKDLEC